MLYLISNSLQVLKLRPTQASAGLLFGALCHVDKQIVDYMNNLGCLQLIEQINQEEQQKQRIQAEKARQRQVRTSYLKKN